MESIKVSDIISFVRSAMDELQVNESSYIPDDGSTYLDDSDMDTIIKSKIEEAVTFVHTNASASKLIDGEVETKMTVSQNVATIMVGNMLRFISLTISGSPTIIELAEEGSTAANMQLNTYTQGTKNKPVAVLTTMWTETIATMDGNNTTIEKEVYEKCIKVYKVKDTSSSCKCIYIPYTKIEGDSVSICKDVVLAVKNYVVGLVLMVYNQTNASEFFEQSKLQMG